MHRSCRSCLDLRRSLLWPRCLRQPRGLLDLLHHLPGLVAVGHRVLLSDLSFGSDGSAGMANHHGGIVRIENHIYGFGNGGLICMNFLTRESQWSDRSIGKGSLIAADGLLFLLSEGHQLGLAVADPGQYVSLGRVKLKSHGRPSWAHPALAKGVLFVRDQQSLTAFQVAIP